MDGLRGGGSWEEEWAEGELTRGWTGDEAIEMMYWAMERSDGRGVMGEEWDFKRFYNKQLGESVQWLTYSQLHMAGSFFVLILENMKVEVVICKNE